MVPAAAAAVVVVLQLCSQAAAQAAGPPPRCPTDCGDVMVPYPFGISAGCYLPGFDLTCDRTRQRPRLLLGDGTLQVLEISVANATVRALNTAGAVNLTYGVIGQDSVQIGNGAWDGLNVSGSPYIVSERRNQLVVSGCNIQVTLIGSVESKNIITGCSSFCSINDLWYGAVLTSPVDEANACSGIGCCETPIPIGRPSYGVELKTLDPNHELDGQVPVAVRIAERGWFDGVAARMKMLDNSLNDGDAKAKTEVPVVLEWAVASTPVTEPGDGNSSCPMDVTNSACLSSHSTCHSVTGYYRTGYVCRCDKGYDGNPYLAGGCQDIDECALPGKCFGMCTNTAGAYECLCPRGTRGDPKVANGCVKSSLGTTEESCKQLRQARELDGGRYGAPGSVRGGAGHHRAWQKRCCNPL